MEVGQGSCSRSKSSRLNIIINNISKKGPAGEVTGSHVGLVITGGRGSSEGRFLII